MKKTVRALFVTVLLSSIPSIAIEQGAPALGCPYKNPFHKTVFAGDHNRAIVMMQTAFYNVDLHAKDTDGDTPLHVAIKHSPNPQEMLDTLRIRSNQDGKGLAVHTANDHNKTPLHLAIERQLPDTFVRTLIEIWDADGSKKRYYQTPVWHRTKQLPKYNFIQGKDNEGYTPFDRAFALRSVALVAVLLEYEAECNTPDEHGVTPFFKVVKENRRSCDTKLFHILMNHVPLDYQDHYGRTALHYAIIYHADDEITYGLMSSKTVNVQDVDGKTALHYAAMQTYADPIYTSLAQSVMLSLISIGGKEKILSIRDNAGYTALQKALALPNYPAIQTLAKYANSLRLLDYTLNLNAFMIDFFIKNGADPNAQDENGDTILHKHIKHGGRTAWIQKLLDAGARTDIPNCEGITAAMLLRKNHKK